MSRWFRFYSDAMRNPKVLRLSDKDFRLWVGLMAVASENDGAIPGDDDLKLMLGMRLDHLKGGLDRLISGGLIDALADGYEPHHWAKFQYKSDTSNERVAKHRAKRNVTVTPPETDTDTDKKEAVASATVSHRPVPLPVSEALGDWNKAAAQAGWATVVKFTQARQTALRNRLRDDGLDGWRVGIARARASPLLGGTDPPSWFDFDWIVKPGNFAKLIEGKYDKSFNTVTAFPVVNTRAADIDNARRELGFR